MAATTWSGSAQPWTYRHHDGSSFDAKQVDGCSRRGLSHLHGQLAYPTPQGIFRGSPQHADQDQDLHVARRSRDERVRRRNPAQALSEVDPEYSLLLYRDILQPFCSPAYLRQQRLTSQDLLSVPLLTSHYRRLDWHHWFEGVGLPSPSAAI